MIKTYLKHLDYFQMSLVLINFGLAFGGVYIWNGVFWVIALNTFVGSMILAFEILSLPVRIERAKIKAEWDKALKGLLNLYKE